MNDHQKDLILILKALTFSAEKHRHQRQDDAAASPYINHPIALVSLLSEHGVTDSETLCAGLLHDTLEDTDTTYAELKESFGRKISDIVQEVSDDKLLPFAERRRLQVAKAQVASKEAKLVKLADKTCNLRDIVNAPPVDWGINRQRDYFDWAKEVADSIGNVNKGLEKAFEAAFELKPS